MPGHRYPHGAVIWGRHVPDDDSRLILTGQVRSFSFQTSEPPLAWKSNRVKSLGTFRKQHRNACFGLFTPVPVCLDDRGLGEVSPGQVKSYREMLDVAIRVAEVRGQSC
jgi:hypothetical protein